jgi:hypothetical protein
VPSSTIKKSNPKNKAPIKPNTSKKLLAVSVIVASTVAVLGFVWLTFGGGGNVLEELRMTHYLENKYKQDFVLNNIQYQSFGIGSKGSYNAQAHPKSNASLVFSVESTDNTYSDSYVRALWSREAKPEAEKAVKNIFGNTTALTDINVWPLAKNGREDTTSSNYINPPTLASQMNINSAIIHYGINITVAGSLSTPQEKENHIAKLKQLIEYVSSKHTGTWDIRYAIEPSKEIQYICLVSNATSRQELAQNPDNCFKPYPKK